MDIFLSTCYGYFFIHMLWIFFYLINELNSFAIENTWICVAKGKLRNELVLSIEDSINSPQLFAMPAVQ